MNARTVKITLPLCLLFLSTLGDSLRAQDNNPENPAPPPAAPLVRRGPGYGGPAEAPVAPIFNIQIENGRLSLEPLRGKPTQNPWSATLAVADASAPGTIDTSVAATMDNLSKYLRVIDTNLNIVLSPGVSDIVISDLKLNTRNARAVHEAIVVASGGAILDNGGGGGGGFFGGQNGMGNNLTFVNARSHDQSSIEVFNLSGYIQTLGKVDEIEVMRKIDLLQQLIRNTIQDLHHFKSAAEIPDFKFHSGTKLLIVIGKPEALEVSRKIVNALSGQSKNGEVNQLLDSPPPPAQK
jgi:hypothetical protein